jgi:hypothetical protein
MTAMPATMTISTEPGTIASAGIDVGNSGGGLISWTASSATPWLTLSSTSGVAPSRLVVRADARGLALGTYTGQITITGSDNSGTFTIPVRLSVVQKLNRVYLPSMRR